MTSSSPLLLALGSCTCGRQVRALAVWARAHHWSLRAGVRHPEIRPCDAASPAAILATADWPRRLSQCRPPVIRRPSRTGARARATPLGRAEHTVQRHPPARSRLREVFGAERGELLSLTPPPPTTSHSLSPLQPSVAVLHSPVPKEASHSPPYSSAAPAVLSYPRSCCCRRRSRRTAGAGRAPRFAAWPPATRRLRLAVGPPAVVVAAATVGAPPRPRAPRTAETRASAGVGPARESSRVAGQMDFCRDMLCSRRMARLPTSSRLSSCPRLPAVAFVVDATATDAAAAAVAAPAPAGVTSPAPTDGAASMTVASSPPPTAPTTAAVTAVVTATANSRRRLHPMARGVGGGGLGSRGVRRPHHRVVTVAQVPQPSHRHCRRRRSRRCRCCTDAATGATVVARVQGSTCRMAGGGSPSPLPPSCTGSARRLPAELTHPPHALPLATEYPLKQ